MLEKQVAETNTSRSYLDGSYLEKTAGTWHLEDAPFKAHQILKMLHRHPEIAVRTVCDIGAGAGGVLHRLQQILPPEVRFVGYEISPQAHALSARFANANCQFVLGDACVDSDTFDVALVMDVVEHVEDCFAFMRQTKNKGRYKIYHIPLDLHVNYLLRGIDLWDSVGHLHLFTIGTALKSVEYSNQKILDYFLTDGAIQGPRTWMAQVCNVLRVPLAKLSQVFAARLFGGYSILILAE